MGSPVPRMLAKPYTIRSWRPAVLSIAVFMFVVTTLFSHRNGYQSPSSYAYPRYIYNGISNFIADRVYENTLYRPGNEDQVHRQWNFSNPCRDFPDTSDILLVMKTGATEVFDKVPTHLLTSLQCMPDFLLFSDMEQQIGQWHIYNALEGVTDDVKEGSAEFDLYKAQLECPVSQKACVDARGKDSAAWSLDKYKFLHMIQRAWEMRPNRQWYVFTEADTYVFWPNLVTYLRGHLDASEPMYVGSVSLINNFPFAHGGSGYVISGILVKQLVENHGDVAAIMDQRAKENCCGDLMLALAIDENENVRVKQAHPMFNGEKPVTLPFGPGHWCEPIFTMHHMNSEEISAVWQYEQTRKSNDILIMKDLFETFVGRHLKDYREDWDNLSDDICYIDQNQGVLNRADRVLKRRQKKKEEMNAIERIAHRSADDCARVCEYEGLDVDSALPTDHAPTHTDMQTALRSRQREHEHDNEFKLDRKCFQWRYHDGVCCTSKSFKLGAPRRPKSGEAPWHSGWYMKGIEDWIESKGECKEPEWRQLY